MKRMTTGMAWVVVAALATPVSTHAQAVPPGVAECFGGTANGELGIAELDCRGECALTMNERWEKQAWSFSVEPLITRVIAGGPADGVLRSGDALVSIDGLLITTAAGGRRYAGVRRGEDVRIQFRRGGRLMESVIHAGAMCAGLSIPDSLLTVWGRWLAQHPPKTDEPTGEGHVAGAPRLLITDKPGSRTIRLEGLPSNELLTALPEGRLGIGFSCLGTCTTTLKNGVRSWKFSGPIEVVGVDPGGPAEKVGIQPGDQIKSLNGKEIDSKDGAGIFSGMVPGQPLELTVVKRSGPEVTVTVVPVPAETLRVSRGRSMQQQGERSEDALSRGQLIARLDHLRTMTDITAIHADLERLVRELRGSAPPPRH
jgi:hypothetical protein